MTELEHLRLLVIEVVDLLIQEIDDLKFAVIKIGVNESLFFREDLLVILLGFLFKSDKTTFELLFTSDVWKNKKIVEGF